MLVLKRSNTKEGRPEFKVRNTSKKINMIRMSHYSSVNTSVEREGVQIKGKLMRNSLSIP
jgi:hypothetical protein